MQKIMLQLEAKQGTIGSTPMPIAREQEIKDIMSPVASC